METKYFKSFSDLHEILSIGHEMTFELLGSSYYFGAPKGKYILSKSDDFDVEFDSLEDFYNYSIDGKMIKDLWPEIDVDVIY
jgi:hypothetical protein